MTKAPYTGVVAGKYSLFIWTISEKIQFSFWLYMLSLLKNTIGQIFKTIYYENIEFSEIRYYINI